MIIFLVGHKDERRWKILKNQYKGHTLIEIGNPPFIDISDAKVYENQFYIEQINNTSKINNETILFVTYNTVINIHGLNQKMNCIYVCNKLKKMFKPANQQFTAVLSYELISNVCIEYNEEIINIFNTEQQKLLFDILRILFDEKIQPYDEINITTHSNDVLFFIPSIFVAHNKSTFIPIDRYHQTIEQLKSIKRHNKIDNKSILLEMSDINELNFDLLSRLTKYGDHVILFGYCQEFRKIARDSNKNKGEIELLRYVLPHFTKKDFSHFYKFGGRYTLDDDFRYLVDSDFNFVCKQIPRNKNPYNQDIIEPVIYGVHRKEIYSFIQILHKMHMCLEYEVNDVERMLVWFRDTTSTRFVDRLRVSGYSAINCIYRNL